MGKSEPPVESVTAASYVIPTDFPESDGTLAWDSTGLIIVTVRAAGETGPGWSYGSPASADLIRGLFADVVVGHSAMNVPGAAEAMSRAVRNIGRRESRRSPSLPLTSRSGISRPGCSSCRSPRSSAKSGLTCRSTAAAVHYLR